MKKLITSKPFLLGVLTALSADVLAFCLLWDDSSKKEFIPDPPSAAEATDSWTENRPSVTVGADEDMAGYSFLKKWIYMPDVEEEVNINAYNDIEVIMNGGRSIKIPDKFSSPQQAVDVTRRMLAACGMVIDDTMPSIIGYLDKNIRISVDKTPLVDADVGINASIRIVNQQTVSKEKLLASGSATEEMLHFLTACIRYGVSVCIAGSTGSGKTTIMTWLLSMVSILMNPQICQLKKKSVQTFKNVVV